MCGKNQIRLSSRDLICAANDDVVADNGTESINLSTKLDLDNFAFLQGNRSFFGIRLKRCVGGDVCARRNGRAVSNSLDDLLALVDFGDLLI